MAEVTSYRLRDPEGVEPKWQQAPRAMEACLEAMVNSTGNEYSAANWALWQIAIMRHNVNALGAYADELDGQVAAARRAVKEGDVEGLLDALGVD